MLDYSESPINWKMYLVSVTDGDTIRARISRDVVISHDLALTMYSTTPKGTAIRLIILDTPERGQEGYKEAKEDLREWLVERTGILRVETYPGGAGWDRMLGDIYVEGDRNDTATQHMLKLGWATYLG